MEVFKDMDEAQLLKVFDICKEWWMENMPEEMVLARLGWTYKKNRFMLL